MNKSDQTPTMDSSYDNEPLNTIPKNEEFLSGSDSFNFIKVFIEHVKNVFRKFNANDSQSVSNLNFIELGRTEEEKEQIEEMCNRVDEESRLLEELKKSGLTPEEWIRGKSEEILNGCSTEEREEILNAIEEESRIETEEQTDALESIVDEINEEQVDNKESAVINEQNSQEGSKEE